MGRARLIIADSEKNANLYYATRFLAPDAFIFAQINGERLLVMSDLEVDRAKAQARAVDVVPSCRLAQQAKGRGVSHPTMLDVVDELFRTRSVKEIEVPADFSLRYADGLRERGYTVRPGAEPFYPERMIKSDEEIASIMETLRVTEEALGVAVELIRNSVILPDGILQIGQKPLTAELLRKAMHLTMMERDCVAQHTIIACGTQGVDPHNEGSGPLRAHEPIVMDVFPQHAQSRYFADLSRTVVKGRAPDKVKRMFDAVFEGIRATLDG